MHTGSKIPYGFDLSEKNNTRACTSKSQYGIESRDKHVAPEMNNIETEVTLILQKSKAGGKYKD